MRNKLFWALSLICLVLFLTLIQSGLSIRWSYPGRWFYATPDYIYLNWTNNYTANITVHVNATFNNVTIQVLNSTAVLANYSQSNTRTQCKPDIGGYYLQVINQTGHHNNTLTNITRDGTIDINISHNMAYNYLQCLPGKYWIQNLTLRDKNRTRENVNVSVFIDIPISASNSPNLQTRGIATFSGRFPENATHYHSYYLNRSAFSNATGIFINLTGWSSSQDVDLFLFDGSGKYLAKSINKTALKESLMYNYLPASQANEMWEIRLFGNSTSPIPYNGVIVFTALNASNASNPLQQLGLVDFGIRNASSKKTINITIENEVNLTTSSISLLKELYYIKRFHGTTPSNFTFIVPDSSIATRVQVSLNWTGATNYSLQLYNNRGTVLASSSKKHDYANVTGSNQEEYLETSDLPTNAELWRVKIYNTSKSTIAGYDSYDVTVKIFVNANNWISTNYTAMRFNKTGHNNSTVQIQVNLTVPNNTLDGSYEGYLKFFDARNVGIKIPIRVNVTTPMLVVNNTMRSNITMIKENYGVNRTRVLNFTVNNTGSYGLTIISIRNSSNKLYHASRTYFANLVFNPVRYIGSQSSARLNITITFNSSMPVGVYEGWILINASNSTLKYASHPYQTFNLTLRLNLTNLLDIRVIQVITDVGNDQIINSSIRENVTSRFLVKYINGTDLADQEAHRLSILNITTWLRETNITSYRIPTTGNLTSRNGTTPIYLDGDYEIISTVLPNKVAGRYGMYVNVSYKVGSRNYYGTGVNTSLLIDGSGLYMRACNSTSISIANMTTYLFAVNVTNYGRSNSTSSYIHFSRPSGCTGYTISSANVNKSGACNVANYDGAGKFTIKPSPFTSSCMIWWIIKAGNSAASACESSIIGTPSGNWFNPRGINVSVTVTKTTTTTTTSPNVTVPETTTTTTTTATTTTTTTIPPAEEVATVTSIQANETATLSISNSDVLKIQNITIKVKNTVTNVKITIKESSLPSGASVVIATDKGAVYKYLEITKVNITDNDIDNVKIKFKVDKPWIENNTIDPSTIALYRYANGNWTKLTTRLLSSDANYYYFETESSSLSIFAIAGEKFFTILGIPMTWLTWVLVGAGVCGIAFLVYLFWPTPGYKPETGEYVFKPKESTFNKIINGIKNTLSKIKNAISGLFKKFKKK